MIEKSTRTPVRPEDQATMAQYACRLRNEPSVDTRFSIQMQFIRELGAKYGQEKAARLLTIVWKMAKAQA